MRAYLVKENNYKTPIFVCAPWNPGSKPKIIPPIYTAQGTQPVLVEARVEILASTQGNGKFEL